MAPSDTGPTGRTDGAAAGKALSEVCADTRPGEAADSVDGVRPAQVAAPATIEEASAVLRVAAARGLRVIARGAGTKLGWGRPPAACDLLVDTARLNRVIDHAAGDLVVKVEAGLPVESLQEVLATSGQQLALDSPVAGATVGGTLATATAGPRRLLYGTARDLLIGVTIVRADGAVASAGGKVVKNVAGYDLGKLFTGSYGTLGLIVTAAFRLHPRPAARAYVTSTVADSRTAVGLVRAVLHSPCVPAAVELDRQGPADPITVVTMLEGMPEGTEARAAAVARLAADLGGEPEIGDRPPGWWGRYPDQPAPTDQPSAADAAGTAGPAGAADPAGAAESAGAARPTGSADADARVLVQVTTTPAGVATVLDTVASADLDTGDGRAGGSRAAAAAVRGSAATGVIHVALPAGVTAASAAAFLDLLRQRLATGGASVTVLRAPRAIRETVDLWGPVPGLSLMRRIKDEFDPEHLLAPGRFVGGI